MGALTALLSNKGYILVNKKIARLFGLHEAVVLGELAAECEYWEAQGELVDGYFYSTLDNVEEHTTLSRYQQARAIETLKKAGLLKTKTAGLPARRYFSINELGVYNALSGLQKTGKQASEKLANRIVQDEQQSLRETYNQPCEKLATNNNKKNNKNSNNNTAPVGGKRFKKPTPDEVRAYCKERGNSVDPDAFCDFYESKGWKVGGQPMKDWKAAVRTWERSRKQQAKPKFAQYEQHESTFDIGVIAVDLDE